MHHGIYEQLITQLVANKISELDKDAYYINRAPVDREEAASVLSRHLAGIIKQALDLVQREHQLENQIAIANKIIFLLRDELQREDFTSDLVEVEGELLKAVFAKADAHFSNIDLHLKKITPYTRLSHSELFTGGNIGLSLESELRKEILSSNRID
ncbi:MAG: DUF3427 domain-containing protein, partial [Flavobacteriales bacterium]|nr:DUF3427 domain-containing protein [Flavobacteriales bacterium]